MRISVHPGEVIAEELETIGMSVNRLAMCLRVPASRMDQIVKCRRGVSPDTAVRLARFFGGSPKFWLNLQTNHDLAAFEATSGKSVRTEVMPLHA